MDFKSHMNIDELEVIDGVVSIGDQSFWDNQITSLVIPDSVHTIGQNAFAANSISSLEIGSGVTQINSNAFKDNQIESLTIHAINPPNFFSGTFLPFDGNPLETIYVLAESVLAYQTNQYWSVYSELIQPI